MASYDSTKLRWSYSRLTVNYSLLFQKRLGVSHILVFGIWGMLFELQRYLKQHPPNPWNRTLLLIDGEWSVDVNDGGTGGTGALIVHLLELLGQVLSLVVHGDGG